MSMDREEMLPCANCGGIAIFGRPDLGHQIFCANAKCGMMSGIFPTKPMARRAWNTRAAPARCDAQSAIARLREFAASLDGDHYADEHEPNLRADIEAVCRAALSSPPSDAPRDTDRKEIKAALRRQFPISIPEAVHDDLVTFILARRTVPPSDAGREAVIEQIEYGIRRGWPPAEIADEILRALHQPAKPAQGDVTAHEKCPHVTPPKNLSEPCQICGALGPWFDSGDCAVPSAERGSGKPNPVTQAERDVLNAAVIPPAPEADAWDRTVSSTDSKGAA